MWWPSLPEPHDARVLSGGLAGARKADALGPRSYAATQAPVAALAPEESRWQTLWTSSRSRKQFSIFAAGAAFVCFSSLITRRALIRKHLAVKPSGLFSPNNAPQAAPGGVDAAEALGLATLNVTGVSVMAVGGGLWAFDISSLEELRTKVRRSMDTEQHVGKTEAEAEEDIEEWLAVTMARLQGKSGKDVEEMIRQVQAKGEAKEAKKP